MADDHAKNNLAGAGKVTSHHAPQLSTLLESGRYSDLTVTCGKRNWKVHKSVLCVQSDFFAKACDGGFKVRNTAASIAGIPTDQFTGGTDQDD
jgi:hypothetical protein